MNRVKLVLTASLASIVLAPAASAAPSPVTWGFTDATASRIDALPEANGPHAKDVAFGDFDRDGDLDVAVAAAAGIFGSRRNKLYRNDDGVLVEVSGTPIIPEFTSADVSRNTAFRDLDGDGWLDLVVVNDAYEFGDPILVFINVHPDGVFSHFSEQGEARGLGYTGDWPCGAVIEDVDDDGDVDLIVGNYGGGTTGQDSMYVNDGAGNFTDVTTSHLPPEDDFTIDMAPGDFNGDGTMDIIVGNGDFPPSVDPFWIYYNDLNGKADDGEGDFRYGAGGAAGKQLLGQTDGHGSARPADFDGDGDLDLYWSNRTGTGDVVLVNEGNDAGGRATFMEMAELPAFVRTAASNKVTITDVDDDGRPDVVVMTASRPAVLRNTTVSGERISFVDWTPGNAFPAGTAHAGMVAAAFDADGDGGTDLLLGAMNGDHLMLRTTIAGVPEGDLGGAIGGLLDADPACVLGAAVAGASDAYALPGVAAGASVSAIVRGPADYRLEIEGDCTIVATSDRGGLGVEEAVHVELDGRAENVVVRVHSLDGDGSEEPYMLEVLARTDDVVRHDPAEWATSVIDFSSEYSETSWSAEQATGVPNTMSYGDISTAWAPLPDNGTLEWITLGFDPPRYASGVTIRETFGNGFVFRVDARDEAGVLHEVWSGDDPSVPGAPVEFEVAWPETAFLVNGVRIHVDTNTTGSWEEIDAVRLHGRIEGDPPGGGCCPGDVDGDGAVGFEDLLAILSGWGPCAACPEDVDGSGAVDFGDLLVVLSTWGPCAG